MAEAIISRASSGINAEIIDQIQNPIYPIANTCLLCVKVVSDNNEPIKGVNVYCNTGWSNWNWTTNEFGKVLFSINRSFNDVCNLIAYKNGINNYADLNNTSSSINLPIPIGTVVNHTIKINTIKGEKIRLWTDDNYTFTRSTRGIYLNISGGGGGGSLYSSYGAIQDGGNGYITEENIIINPGQIYKLTLGLTGRGGYKENRNYTWNGATGGTTVFGQYSAIGGQGGKVEPYVNYNTHTIASGGNGAKGGKGAPTSSYNGYSGESGWCYITPW